MRLVAQRVASSTADFDLPESLRSSVPGFRFSGTPPKTLWLTWFKTLEVVCTSFWKMKEFDWIKNSHLTLADQSNCSFLLLSGCSAANQVKLDSFFRTMKKSS